MLIDREILLPHSISFVIGIMSFRMVACPKGMVLQQDELDGTVRIYIRLYPTVRLVMASAIATQQYGTPSGQTLQSKLKDHSNV
jgi:hypothetical protein